MQSMQTKNKMQNKKY